MRKFNWSVFRLVLAFVLFLFGGFILSYKVVSFICLIIAYLLIGGDVLWKSFRNILKGHIFDENFLMSIATLGAFGIGDYKEAVAVMLFYQLGEYISDLAVDRSKNKITSLMDLRSDVAHLLVDGVVRDVTPTEVKLGDMILVKPGERIPLDGKVVDGKGLLDTAMLTGESVPQQVNIADKVYSGSVSLNSLLQIEVTALMKDSTVSKILELIEHASEKKTDTERFITKFARVYTPIVVLLAVLLCIMPTLLGYPFADWFYRSLVFLVISCPCALVISIPLGFFSGIGAASKKGVLIKGSNSLESLSKVKTVVFDKTGTLTEGSFAVVKTVTYTPFTKDEVLFYAAISEYHSNHPIALSIKEAYGKKLSLDGATNQQELAGHGVSVLYRGKKILVGNDKLLATHGIQVPEVLDVGTIIYVAVDDVCAGYFLIADEIKKDAKETVLALKRMGIEEIVVLSGDNRDIVTSVCQELGIMTYYAELLPQQKVEKVEVLMKERNPKNLVLFVGDGMNDAPVLMLSDVGVSMGGIGSDAAIEASDMVIMDDQLLHLPDAIKIAVKTKRIVLQNIFLALGVKLVVLLLGAIGFSSIWAAVFADVGVTILAVLNALRILRIK